MWIASTLLTLSVYHFLVRPFSWPRFLCGMKNTGGGRSRRLAAAALDVFAREPLDPASPLLDAPNLVLTPHIGSASVATRSRMADLAVENLLAGLEGRAMPRCANPGFAAFKSSSAPSG